MSDFLDQEIVLVERKTEECLEINWFALSLLEGGTLYLSDLHIFRVVIIAAQQLLQLLLTKLELLVVQLRVRKVFQLVGQRVINLCAQKDDGSLQNIQLVALWDLLFEILVIKQLLDNLGLI
jgi:hypothetical protein